MEKEIEDLTKKLVAQCAGKSAGVVIGASFNLAQTALNQVPDKRLLAAVAATLRDQAAAIDKMIDPKKH